MRDKLFQEHAIIVFSGSLSGIAEEAPFATKDIDKVADTVHEAGMALKVAKLKPMAVIKGRFFF